MKKTLLLIALITLSISVMAQNKTQHKRIAEVRTMYAQAMENIKANSELPEADNSVTIDIHRMMPGTGLQSKKISLYATDADSEEELYKWNVYFMSCKYNVAAMNFVEEYVVNAETGRPVFFLQVGDSYQHDGKDEVRIYFNEDSSPCFMQVTAKDAEGALIEKREIKDIVNDTVFNHLMHSFDSYMESFASMMNVN